MLKLKLFILITLSIVFIGCGSGGDEGSNQTPSGNVEAKFYGKWIDSQSGTQIDIDTTTYLEYSAKNDNLLFVTDNGETTSYLRASPSFVNLKGSLTGATTPSNTRALSTNLKSESNNSFGSLENVKISITNISDENIKSEATTDENGKFTNDKLPAGKYKLVAQYQDNQTVDTVIELNNKEENLGEFKLVDKDNVNFKAELILEDGFIFADNKSHKAKIRVKNISDIYATGIQFDIKISDSDSDNNFYEPTDINYSDNTNDTVGTISSKEYKDIDISFTFSPMYTNSKDIVIHLTIDDDDPDIPGWNEELKFTLYKDAFDINIATSTTNLKGYIRLPFNDQIVPIDVSKGKIKLPLLLETQHYPLVIVNTDISQETKYSIGINKDVLGFDDFKDTSAYENDDIEEESNEIKLNEAILSYSSYGDLDYWKIITSEDLSSKGGANTDDVINVFDNEYSSDTSTEEETIVTKDGLVAHYKFDGDLKDSSGNGNDGIEYGNVKYVDGTVGKAISFDGILSDGGYKNPDRIKVKNSDSLKFDRYVSFAYWVQINGDKIQTSANCTGDAVSGKGGTVFGKSGDRNGMYISTSETASSIGFQPWLNGKGGGVKDIVSAYNTFRHETYVVDSKTNSIKIYINGLFVEEKIGDIDFSYSNNRDLYIGATYNKYISGVGGACLDYWYPLDGLIDDFRIYNIELDASEIKKLYEIGDTSSSQKNQETQEVEVTIPSKPSNARATDGTYADKIKITWDSVSGATYYKLYYAASSYGTYSYLENSYDTSVSKSVTSSDKVYYKVKACNDAGCSDYSSYNSGYANYSTKTKVYFYTATYDYVDISIADASASGYPDSYAYQYIGETDIKSGDTLKFIRKSSQYGDTKQNCSWTYNSDYTKDKVYYVLTGSDSCDIKSYSYEY